MVIVPDSTSGVNGGLASLEITWPRVGRTILSEGVTLCDGCGELIEGLATFVEGAPQRDRRPWGTNLLGLYHEDCAPRSEGVVNG